MNEIRPLLEKAEEDIRAAEVLMKENFNRIAVSRLYYAMFYVTEALLLSKKLSFSSHKAVISSFGKEFVKTDKFGAKFHRALIDAFEDRQRGDYETEVDISEEQTVRYINLAKEFLKESKKYLKIK